MNFKTNPLSPKIDMSAFCFLKNVGFQITSSENRHDSNIVCHIITAVSHHNIYVGLFVGGDLRTKNKIMQSYVTSIFGLKALIKFH